MKKILQINVTSNWGSTGRISEQCNEYASKAGFECYTAYGRYYTPSKFHTIKVGSQVNVVEHFFEDYLFDNEGLASRCATRSLIKRIQLILPDIVHLHNIHDHWLNYKILFEFLNQTDIKVVWTFHDFWAITGHCTHFVSKSCAKFKTQCEECPFTHGHILPLLKRTTRNFKLKKRLFSSNKNLTIVPVSEWVGENVCQSFLKNKEIRVIPNGVDTKVFKPTGGFSHSKINNNSFIIMAVSSQWKSGSKGLDDYKALSYLLKVDEVIVLVGIPDDAIRQLPNNIIGIKRTNNQQELAALYTRANVICSFSSAETFGLTIVEGYACGTPAVVYDNTAPPSLITPETGFVVPNKDYKEAYVAIQKIKSKGKENYADACIRLANEKYKKDKCFGAYISLYNELLSLK